MLEEKVTVWLVKTIRPRGLQLVEDITKLCYNSHLKNWSSSRVGRKKSRKNRGENYYRNPKVMLDLFCLTCSVDRQKSMGLLCAKDSGPEYGLLWNAWKRKMRLLFFSVFVFSYSKVQFKSGNKSYLFTYFVKASFEEQVVTKDLKIKATSFVKIVPLNCF